MAEIYFKDSNGVRYNDDELGITVLDRYVPDFPVQTLIQDVIPYSNQKVTYGRRRENRIIILTIMLEGNDVADFNSKVEKLSEILSKVFDVGFIDLGYEYSCNLTGEIVQENIKNNIKKYTYTFETTTPNRIAI